MNFITSREEFNAAHETLLDLIALDKPLGRSSFSNNLTEFRLLSFSSILNRYFFRAIRELGHDIGDASMYLMTTDPDPVEYERDFGRYNAITFDASDTSKDFLSTLNDGPNGISAASIMDNSDLLFVFPSDKKWLVAGSREINLAMCCFVNRDVRTKFQRNYKWGFFKNAESAATFSFETTGRTINPSSLPV
ncbi:MAG: hypothetical protein Q4G62_08855 [Pseudomonadota bacterium]|nr:hypothetical protein [Pseudomonadota bacterium]